jgi:RecB family exonuclease
VRELQIDRGRDELLRRVEALTTTVDEIDALSEHLRRRTAAAATALPALQLLGHTLDELPQTAKLLEWMAAMERLGKRLGLQLTTAEPADAPAASPEDHDVNCLPQPTRDSSSADNRDAINVEAWRSIRGHFRSLMRLDARLAEPSKQYSRAEFLQLLIDVATHEPARRVSDETGRVRVLKAASARTLSIKHLYLAGMSEQAFPLPEPAGRLYSDADYGFFQRAGRPEGRIAAGNTPPGDVTRPQEEMLLFYEVLTRATASITISYPALDERAQSLPPSPYVTELERLLGGELFRGRRPVPQPSPIPAGDEVYSQADWRIQAVDRALEGDPSSLGGLFAADRCRNLAAAMESGLRIIHSRADRDRFTAAEGLLSSPAVAARLRRRFGPHHLWSPSQWELYAACPYKFFLSEVLGLQPLGDLTLETDFGRRGGLLHHVLATFYRRWQTELQPARRDPEEFLLGLLRVLDAEVAALGRAGVDGALAELDRRQIAKWSEKHFDQLSAYLSAHSKLEATLAPSHFELRFGPARPGDSGEDPASVDKPFELDIGGDKLRVTGRIDRIDVGQVGERTVFSVIDYKTGRTTSLSKEQIATGERLQLPIYVAAAQALVFGGQAEPIAAGYWTMDRGFDHKGALNVLHGPAGEDDSTNRWTDLYSQAVASIARFVAAIRSGQFPVHSRDENCTGRCEFSTVCRIAQIRAIGKTWPLEADRQQPTPKS